MRLSLAFIRDRWRGQRVRYTGPEEILEDGRPVCWVIPVFTFILAPLPLPPSRLPFSSYLFWTSDSSSGLWFSLFGLAFVYVIIFGACLFFFCFFFIHRYISTSVVSPVKYLSRFTISRHILPSHANRHRNSGHAVYMQSQQSWCFY